jgi:hypothetical protein
MQLMLTMLLLHCEMSALSLIAGAAARMIWQKLDYPS